MRIYCRRCNYKFTPKADSNIIMQKSCPFCSANGSLVKDLSAQDIIAEIDSEDTVIRRKE